MISVDDYNIFTWIWHDAQLVMIQGFWAADGDLSLLLRCQPNAEEDTSAFAAFGIATQLVDIKFVHVWSWQTSAQGDTSSPEVIDSWNILSSSPALTRLRQRVPHTINLNHHQISCVGGTTMEVIFEQITLSEVST